MGLLSIFMTAIGLSMDAFAVAVAKGMLLKRNFIRNAIKIALFFGFFQGIMPLIGWWTGTYFQSYIESFDHWIAFIMLGVIGGKMIFESLKGEKKTSEEKVSNSLEEENYKNNSSSNEEVSVDVEDINEDLSYKSLTILAIATSIDALAVGISFAFLNVNIIKAVIIVGITTFILCLLAVLIGKKLGRFLERYAEIFGGIILIFIGTKILIDHLFI